ncbi:MAG TPA: ankyrin repeat domain-containing protein [Phycisphaerales bacterium]|nr:ankyrin repeat domain-containing protein [Phycisphaerales bacterium]
MSRSTPARDHTYWSLACAAGSLKSGLWQLEAGDWEWERRIALRTREGRPLAPGEWPEAPPSFIYDEVGSRPDVRWNAGDDLWIVSDALRAWLEAHAPGCAEFRAVRIAGPRRSSLHRDYWAVNWLHAWECHHEGGPEIDTGRIPAGELIGVVRDGGCHQGSVLARRALKAPLESRAFVGLRFERVRHAGRRTATVRRKSPLTGKMETIERRLLPGEPEFDVDAYFAAGGGANDPTEISGSTAFHGYVQWHSIMDRVDPAVVLRFLAEGGDPNAGHDQPNVSALLVALEPKTPELLRALDAHGADWNVFNGLNGFTPLMAAATDGNVEAVELLLELGADPRQPDRAGMTAVDHVNETIKGAQDGERVRLLRRVRELLK